MNGMPKMKVQQHIKVNNVFPAEFTKTPMNELLYMLCKCVAPCSKKFFVDSHRQTAKHQKRLSQKPKGSQSFLKFCSQDFATKVTEVFLSADVPLYKSNNPEPKKLLQVWDNLFHLKLAAEGRSKSLATELERVKSQLSDTEVFLVCDSSKIVNHQHLNIFIGSVKYPYVTYLVDCKVLPGHANSPLVCQSIDDILKCLNIECLNIYLLLTDAAKCMQVAGSFLKALHSRLFHVTCAAHLLYHCATKIQASFPGINALISSVKAATEKNLTRKAMFQGSGTPPQPVLTRWTSWWRAALFYAETLPEVKRIVNSFEGDGVLVREAKTRVAACWLDQQMNPRRIWENR